MTQKYFALLTNQGAAKLANAAALGTKVDLKEMAVGDGGGTLPTPDPVQTKLIGEKRRAQLNSLSVDAANSSQIIAEQIIPEGEGGFWIREIGLYDADGVLIAVANCAETYKPQLAEGSGRTQTVRMILIVNSTSAVTLKIDPSVVLATRQYVDDAVVIAKQYADSAASSALKSAGSYTDDEIVKAKKGSSDALKQHVQAEDPHTQYLKTADALSEIAGAGKVEDVVKNLKLRESFSGIAGHAGNVKMSVTAASASATLTADEIIVEETLGGRQFRVVNFNKTINLAKTGAGGMDVAPWVSGYEGFCAIYVILNPTTGTTALLGVNATDAAAPVIYAGSKMPAGYTASALASVWRVTGSVTFRIGYQRGRKFSCPLTDVINTSSNPGGFTGVNLASCVPLNALTMTGYAYCNLGAGTTGVATLRIASDTNNCGFFQAFSGVGVSLGSDIYFELLLATPRTLFYDFAWSTSGASNAIIGVSGYTI